MAVDQENPKEVPLDCDGQHPMIMPGHTLASVTEKISDVTFLPVNKMPKQWWIGFTIAFCLMQLLFFGVYVLFSNGVSVWGLNVPVAWGFANGNPDKISMEDCYCAGFLLCELAAKEPMSQVCGCTIITDATNFGFKQLRAFGVEDIKVSSKFMQVVLS